jgi:hypothetical protein
LKLTGAATYDRLLYHATVTTTGLLLPQSYRDDTVLRASSRIDYTLLANTALFAQLSWRRTRYSDASTYADRSSREWRAIAGYSGGVTGLIRISGGIGGYWRDYDPASIGPRFGTVSGLAWDLHAIYAVTTLTTLSLQTKREYVDANVSQSPGYVASSLHVELDHEFLRQLLLSVSFGDEADRFRFIQRQDRMRDFAMSAEYWISPHLLVKPRMEWLERDSSGADAGPRIPEFRSQLALSVRN